MELKQQLRLTQQLVMTPQLQQAIRLLQLSRLELVEEVRKELDNNPVLSDEEPELVDRLKGVWSDPNTSKLTAVVVAPETNLPRINLR